MDTYTLPTPPKTLERTYTFTFSELELMLRLFGTSCAVEGQNRAMAENPVTCHTDAWVCPKVSRILQSLNNE